MNKLSAHIIDLIHKNGPMSVADYMRLALLHPEYGYYRYGDPLGQAGDFITAPEISQMFGEMIGVWCADIWHQLGKPADMTLLEIGPGRGTLMHDALRITAKIPGFHQSLRLYLLESSETLRATQIEKLGMYQPTYIHDLPELPEQPIVVIGNEFFDAMPIRQFEKGFHGWCERLVTVRNGDLAFVLSSPDEDLKRLIPETMHEAKLGTIYELSPVSLNLMRDLSGRIVKNGGAGLFVDYGYVTPDGKPTLQAVANHKYADVLDNVGEADLTALVDFGLLRRAATMQSANVFGAVGQGEFLLGLGMDVRAGQLKHRATTEQAAAIDVALHRLTDAAEMGSLFKVMAVASSNLKEIAGF